MRWDLSLNITSRISKEGMSAWLRGKEGEVELNGEGEGENEPFHRSKFFRQSSKDLLVSLKLIGGG